MVDLLNTKKAQESINKLKADMTNAPEKPEQVVETKRAERYDALKHAIESLSNKLDNIYETVNNLDNLPEVRDSIFNFKILQSDLLATLGKELDDTDNFRKELNESITNFNAQYQTLLDTSITKAIKTSENYINKATEKSNEIIEQCMNETIIAKQDFTKTKQELIVAKDELLKQADKFSNPKRFISKQDIILMAASFILGVTLCWGIMRSSADSIINTILEKSLVVETTNE